MINEILPFLVAGLIIFAIVMIVVAIRSQEEIDKLSRRIGRDRERFDKFVDETFDTKVESRVLHSHIAPIFGEPAYKSELYKEYILKEECLPVIKTILGGRVKTKSKPKAKKK